MKDVEQETGPPLRPTAGLRAWLEETGATDRGRRRRLRLPVVLRWRDPDAPCWEEALVGGTPPPPGADVLRLRLDDTGLGISLADRMRGRITPEKPWCALWLEGTWGPLVPLPVLADEDDPLPTFAVLAVLGEVDPGDAATGNLRPLAEPAP